MMFIRPIEVELTGELACNETIEEWCSEMHFVNTAGQGLDRCESTFNRIPDPLPPEGMY